MLEPGAPLPDVMVWSAPAEPSVRLADALAGEGHALLCFYPFDFSSG
jgi:peroxiredoxin